VTGVSESQSTFDSYFLLWFCAWLASPNGKNSETNCLVETRQLCRTNWPCPPTLAHGDFLVVVPVHTGAQHTVNNTRYNGQLQSRIRRHTPNSSNSTPCNPTIRHVHQQRLGNQNHGTPMHAFPNVHGCPFLSGKVPEGRGYTWRHKILQGPVIPNSAFEAPYPHSGDGGTCSSILTALIPNVWNDSTSPKARD
jgi:hypothetical protein